MEAPFCGTQLLGLKSTGIHCMWLFCLLIQDSVYMQGAIYADYMTEEVTVVYNNLHSISALLNVVNRQLSEWQSICLF